MWLAKKESKRDREKRSARRSGPDYRRRRSSRRRVVQGDR